MKQYQKLYDWLDETSQRMGNGVLADMFRACYLSTLETTVERMPDSSTYVVTGDIPAMWLRDSSAQVRHYIPLCAVDRDVDAMVRGLVKRQFAYIAVDPYANAFNREANGMGHRDDPADSDWVWERKYELDSLCYPLSVAEEYYKTTSCDEVFDETFLAGLSALLSTVETEQRHGELSSYRFRRQGELSYDTLENEGRGGACGYTGMSWSGFRPSDDRCSYGYLVPANLFAASVLGKLGRLASPRVPDAFKRRAAHLSAEIAGGVRTYGTVLHEKFGRIYAYETDGLGNSLLMDDANVPSLLSLPYLGCVSASDPVYQNTRRFVLSEYNPYYYVGRCASGVGSPHTPPDYIWHIGIIMQGLTAEGREEKRRMLGYLMNTHAGTQLMHEGFHKDDPGQFTRAWFAWANSLFAVFLLDCLAQDVPLAELKTA